MCHSGLSLGTATPSFKSLANVKEEGKAETKAKTVNGSSFLQKFSKTLWSFEPDHPMFTFQLVLDDFEPMLSQFKV